MHPIKKIGTKISHLISRYKKSHPPIQKPYQIVFKIIKKDKLLQKTGSCETVTQIAKTFMSNNDSPAMALREMATFLMNSGYPDLGQKYFKHSLKLSLLPATYSLYLQCLMLVPSCDEKTMYKIASRYDKLFLSHIQRYEHYDNELNTNRKLNIGHICHFFHN